MGWQYKYRKERAKTETEENKVTEKSRKERRREVKWGECGNGGGEEEEQGGKKKHNMERGRKEETQTEDERSKNRKEKQGQELSVRQEERKEDTSDELDAGRMRQRERQSGIWGRKEITVWSVAISNQGNQDASIQKSSQPLKANPTIYFPLTRHTSAKPH